MLGQKLLEDARFAEARVHLDEALAGMQTGRMVYDQARILETLGDLASATAGAGADVWFWEALAITESCGFTRDAERVREKLVALGELDGQSSRS